MSDSSTNTAWFLTPTFSSFFPPLVAVWAPFFDNGESSSVTKFSFWRYAFVPPFGDVLNLRRTHERAGLDVTSLDSDAAEQRSTSEKLLYC